MIGVVLDTNIVVSALLIPQGPPARVFLMALQNQDTQLCVSADTLFESDRDSVIGLKLP